jgi:hypothetical protein
MDPCDTGLAPDPALLLPGLLQRPGESPDIKGEGRGVMSASAPNCGDDSAERGESEAIEMFDRSGGLGKLPGGAVVDSYMATLGIGTGGKSRGSLDAESERSVGGGSFTSGDEKTVICWSKMGPEVKADGSAAPAMVAFSS